MLYHITTQGSWEKAKTEGIYTADSLSSEGFIHCSTATQVQATANRFFHGCRDLMLLQIDQNKVDSEVIYENLEGGSELFPHVYGPLPLAAIREALVLTPVADGSFSINLPEDSIPA